MKTHTNTNTHVQTYTKFVFFFAENVETGIRSYRVRVRLLMGNFSPGTLN